VTHFCKRYILKPIAFFPIKKPKTWAVTKASLGTLPTIILAYLSYRFATNQPPEQVQLKEFFDGNHIALISLFAAPFGLNLLFTFYEWFAKYLNEREVNYFPSVQLATTISCLNIIVGRKLERFGRVCKTILSNAKTQAEAFEVITQPDEQISEIVAQLWGAMTQLTGLKELKLVLVEADASGKLSYGYHMPTNKKPHDSVLVSEKSLFHQIAKEQKFYCIDDIAAHAAKLDAASAKKKKKLEWFQPTPGQTPVGSIVGFPIVHKHLNRVIYVVTLKSDQPKALTKSCEAIYGEMWQVFADRITLEYSLKEIKRHARNN
jgi:hypothetical protein